jgi:hypothetical protein
MSQIQLRTLLGCLLTAFILCAAAMAQANPDRVQIGRDMSIDQEEKAGDLVCVACSIHVRGQVSGDVVAVGGSVTIDPGSQVAGGVTTVFGGLRMADGAQVQGDVTVVGGVVRRDAQTTIAGNITTIGGAAGIIVVVVVPMVLLIGLGWLILWLVRRERRPAPVPA